MQRGQLTAAQTTVRCLSNELIAALCRDGHIRSAAVEAAFRAVPRHLFLPDLPLDQVYSDQAFPTKFLDGRAVSSSSQPAVMATMLEQLDLQAGQRVLEIGAGTGYNAALIAQIVGDTGQVVTLDIDDDIVAAARSHLEAAGFERVKVVCGDGTLGYPSAAPYDRIILTVGAGEIAPVWQAQLADDGRLVVPLALRVPQKSVVFEQVDSVLTSVAVHGGIFFIPLRGALSSTDNVIQMGADISLTVAEGAAKPIDTEALYEGLQGAGNDWTTAEWVTPGEAEAGLATWIELRSPNFCRIFATGRAAEDSGLPNLSDSSDGFRYTFGLCSETTLALLTRPMSRLTYAGGHQNSTELSFPLAIRTIGQDQSLAQRLHDEVRAWDAAGRPSDRQLRIRVFSLESSAFDDANEPGAVLTKRTTRFVCDWG